MRLRTYSPHTLSFTRCAAVARLEHLLGWTGKYLHRRRTLDKDAWSRTVRPSRCSGRHLMNAAWRHLHVGWWVVEGRRVPSYHALRCGSTRLLIDHVRTMCYSCWYDRVDCLLTICATAPTLNTITVLNIHVSKHLLPNHDERETTSIYFNIITFEIWNN